MSIFDIGIIQILQKQGYKVRHESTLKCWKKDDLVDLIRSLENNWANALERCENQYKTLCGYHERQDKYRWHDLRKNPEDLPKVEKQYLVAWQDGTYDFLWFAYVDGYGYDWQVAYFPDVSSIIGWKEIEPFEGVE